MTQKQAIVAGLSLLAFLWGRKVVASLEGGGVLDMRRTGEAAGSGTSSEAECVCADPKPGIYVRCSCDDPSAIATSSGYEAML